MRGALLAGVLAGSLTALVVTLMLLWQRQRSGTPAGQGVEAGQQVTADNLRLRARSPQPLQLHSAHRSDKDERYRHTIDSPKALSDSWSSGNPPSTLRSVHQPGQSQSTLSFTTTPPSTARSIESTWRTIRSDEPIIHPSLPVPQHRSKTDSSRSSFSDLEVCIVSKAPSIKSMARTFSDDEEGEGAVTSS